MKIRAAAIAGTLAVVPLLLWQVVQAPFTPPTQESGVRLLFVGDIMFDRNVARHAAASTTEVLFRGVEELFKSVDGVVINLEGTITNEPSLAQRDNTILRFTFDPKLVEEALKPLPIVAASLANNHTYDFQKPGYASTREHLQKLGIIAFGHPYNVPGALSAKLFMQGKTLCLVGYHALFDPDTGDVLKELIEMEEQCWRTVVFAHWGEEYNPVANNAQKEAAHAFIDAGADLVVGAHPHVVQPVEVYKGKAIFYSLGNALFDQYFSWETSHGLAVEVHFEEGRTTFKLVPLAIGRSELSVAREEAAARILKATESVAQWQLP